MTHEEAANKIAEAYVDTHFVGKVEWRLRLLPSYELIVDGKRKALIDVDDNIARVIDKTTTNWMTVDGLIKFMKGE